MSIFADTWSYTDKKQQQPQKKKTPVRTNKTLSKVTGYETKVSCVSIPYQQTIWKRKKIILFIVVSKTIKGINWIQEIKDL